MMELDTSAQIDNESLCILVLPFHSHSQTPTDSWLALILAVFSNRLTRFDPSMGLLSRHPFAETSYDSNALAIADTNP